MMDFRNVLLILATALAAACAGDAGVSGDAPPDPGGGNVSFGGAQDIGQFRDILAGGGIPGPNTLDANGFFNEHYTELPSCTDVLCVNAMVAVGTDWLNATEQASLFINLSTGVDVADLERKPLNLVAVVDVSGSMSGDRIKYVKQGLNTLIDQLEEGDRLALVTYSNTAKTIFGFEPGLSGDQMHEAIETLQAKGFTNIYDGLQMGLELATSVYDQDRQNRVILLSDGVATTGNTADGAIIDMADPFIAEGLGLTTVGVGTDFNVNLMRGLAERGAGNFYFLESPLAVTEVFTDELSYFVSAIALEVSIDVYTGAEYKLGEVVGTRLWTTRNYGGSVNIPSVFLASRTEQDPESSGRRGGGSSLFVELKPTGETWPSNLARVNLSYKLPGSDELIEKSVDVVRPFAEATPPDELSLSDDAMGDLYATYNMFLGLRDAAHWARYDYRCAASSLRSLKMRGEAWNVEANDPDIAADLDLVRLFLENLASAGDIDSVGVDACVSMDSGYEYGDEVFVDDQMYMCSATATTGSKLATFAIILVTLLVPRRRRRSPGRGRSLT